MKLNPQFNMMPKNPDEVAAFKRFSTTKALVNTKLQEMKELDETPKDLVSVSTGKVTVEGEKFTSHKTGLFAGKSKLSGSAEFSPEGEPKNLALFNKEGEQVYGYEELADGSKVYMAPNNCKGSRGEQIVLERPNGTLFMDDTVPFFAQSSFESIQRTAETDDLITRMKEARPTPSHGLGGQTNPWSLVGSHTPVGGIYGLT